LAYMAEGEGGVLFRGPPSSTPMPNAGFLGSGPQSSTPSAVGAVTTQAPRKERSSTVGKRTEEFSDLEIEGILPSGLIASILSEE